MQKSNVWLVGALALFSVAATEPVLADPAGDCGPTNGVFGGGAAVPDAGSVVIGPAQTSGPACIEEVAVNLNLFHTLVGDLIVRMGYDRDCDGIVDTEEVTLMCRPGRGCTGGTGRGCEANAGGFYVFTSGVAAEFAEPCPADFVAGGCFGVVDGTPDFDVFHGEPLGGCFWLYVEDAEAGETGFLKSFAVSITEMTCAVPIEQASWGHVKAVFVE